LADARKVARDDPGSEDAAVAVLGRLIADDTGVEAVLDAAKLAAQKAPREAAGNAVAMLAGEVIWRVAGQPKLAEPYFRRVRRSEPAHPVLLDFYRDAFSGPQDGSQLMQVLVQARRALTDDPERSYALAEEMAELAEKSLGSVDRAIETWRSALREDGFDARVADKLERLYRDGEKWSALGELLKDAVDRIEPSEDNKAERIEKLLEISALYSEQLNLDAMALTTLQRILDIDPGHAASLQALAENYAKQRRWNDLLGVYARLEESAAAEGDEKRRGDMLRRIAGIWVNELGNPQRALEPLQAVLEIDAGDREAREMLAAIHEQRRDWRSLLELRREDLADAVGE